MIKRLINCIYPKKCIICNKFTDSKLYICSKCMPTIEPISANTCRKCGLTKEHCECNKYVYHFTSIIAPFKNDGAAKAAMYNIKYHGMKEGTAFFSDYMAQLVNKKYKNINFDYAVSIPTSRSSKRQRGFDQAELICKSTAKKLNLPYLKKCLLLNRTPRSQHTLSANDRFLNTKDLYSINPKYDLSDKTILLMDDIKTTGASLDEAAKTLLLYGAESVYCVTALVTE